MDEALKYIFTFIAGSGSVIFYNHIKGRLQKMECHLIEDDILSKIPIAGEDGLKHENIYCKTFRIINTTNMDIDKFRVIFQFDSSSVILESYNRCKAGHNEFKMKKGKQPNECYIIIEKFNRTESVDCVFKIGNVNNNHYYVTECDCIGFKIKCKDKRKSKSNIKSERSNHVLTKLAPISNLE